MSEAFLNIIEPGHEAWELDITVPVTAIGRALDNQVCLEDDSNVSRYHAEIEQRGDSFWIVDLGSSNGTTVNDVPVEFELRLSNGDLISIGGSSVIEFHLGARPQPKQSVVQDYEEPPPEDAPVEPSSPAGSPPEVPGAISIDAAPSVAPAVPTPTIPSPSAGLSPLIIVGAVGGGLLLTAIAAVAIVMMWPSGCAASARIVSPQSGTTVRGPVTIRLEVEDSACIHRVIYQLDGVEVASAETAPYDIVLDPSRIQGLSPGNHILSIVIEDDDGEKKVQGETILLAFSGGSPIDTPTTTETKLPDLDITDAPVTHPTGTVDVPALADRLAVQITRKSGYVFDRDFAELIRVRTGEYRAGGYSDRARRYRREINKAFRDQGLDPLLGYILAMSRSRFNENATGEGVGIWQLPYNLVQAQGYLSAGETEAALKDPKRSSEVAAAYTKALVSTFESTDDFMYVVACFGLPLSQAGQVRTQLATTVPDPIARRDFMRVVKLGVVKGDQVDRVVRFFAAGIVTENPQPFGLGSEQPFSSLF